MKISGLFVVKEDCIHTLSAMKESRRLDYLLGLDEDKSFEKSIVAMEDYIYTPSSFYQMIAHNVLESNILTKVEKHCVYDIDKHMICVINPATWLFLCEELEQNDNLDEGLTKYFGKPVDRRQTNAISLREKAETFIELLKLEYLKRRYLIMVFEKLK